MDSITLFCTKKHKLKPWIIIPVSLILVACAEDKTNFGIHLVAVETRTTRGMFIISIHQDLILSREARNALRHGVPLTIQTELVLRDSGSNRKLKQTQQEFEIRFLPLSDRYQLTSSERQKVSTYPRLRHALAELATVEFSFPGSEMTVDDMEIRARSFLQKQRMPPPMRLPAWFSSQWRHDSGWVSWPISSPSGV
jgi:hypothetical protein